MARHPVLTRDFPENLCGGIMICGINFGWSKRDEEEENKGSQNLIEVRSFFSDKTVNNTKFRNTILKWLSIWGVDLNCQPGTETSFEKSFFQTNWLDSQTRSIDSDLRITERVLVEHADGILHLLKERRPSVILFFSHMLIDALNDIRLRVKVESILGSRTGNAETCFAEIQEGRKNKFKLLHQKWGDVQIISLPHPAARGISLKHIELLKPPIHVLSPILNKKVR